MFTPNVSLQPYNTFGIQVNARYFAAFTSVEELIQLFEQVKKDTLPFLILGGGSNLLLTKNFEGYVLKNELLGYTEEKISEEETILAVGAGENWHQFVMHTLNEGWCGLENLSLIPGNVGASPMQNIGAYGVEIKDKFEYLEALELATNQIKTFSKEDCQFGYRESVFKRELKNKFVITKVAFRLQRKFVPNTSYGAINQEMEAMGIQFPTAKDVSNAVIRIRESKLPNPKEIGNAGSFFKNPVVENSLASKIKEKYPEAPVFDLPNDPDSKKMAAGWLIEKAGLKGYNLGNHGVHAKQALVLVNYGGATGNQIFDLSSYVVKTIQDKFGVTLEREVNIL